MMVSDAVINPGRAEGEPRLPAAGLLLINPGEVARAVSLAKEHRGARHFLFNSNLYLIPANGSRQSFFVAGPAVGAPMAVMTLEKLTALGGRRFIVFGWCGSLISSLRIGDVLLPTWALSEEGTSAHYANNSRPESSGTIRAKLDATLRKAGIAPVAGPLWTIDAPYRETRAKMHAYSERSIMGVDMEFSALCTVASYRGVELAAVMLVSDELWREPWKPGFTSREFKQRRRAVLKTVFDLCGDL